MVKTNDILEIINQCMKSRTNIFTKGKEKKQAEFSSLKARITSSETDNVNEEKAISIVSAIAKIALAKRGASSRPTTTSSKLLTLLNTKFSSLAMIIVQKYQFPNTGIGVEKKLLTYQDLKVVAGYEHVDMSKMHKKSGQYVSNWRDVLQTGFSIVIDQKNNLHSQHSISNREHTSTDWDNSVPSYSVKKESDIFKQIESYMNETATAKTYTSASKEATRMERARRMSTESNKSESYILNCQRRLREGEDHFPPPPKSCG